MSDNLPPKVSKSITKEEAMRGSLPHEILTQVVMRLPIKSIITWTCVSKTWKSFIQNPTFISTHLHHSSNNNLLLFRLCPKPLVKAVKKSKRVGDESEVYALHWDDDNNFRQYTRFDDFPFHGESATGVFRVVGTFNGLICLADDLYRYAYNFILWNPCVQRYVKLPYPNFSLNTIGFFTAAVGFGFDSKTNDYKVVRFVTPVDDHEGESPPKVEVYSLAAGKWRVVTAQCPECAVRSTIGVCLRLQAFVNGALHLVCFKRTQEIGVLYFVLVFDLEDEVFREISLPLPEHSNWNDWQCVSILAYGNSIALLEPRFSNLPTLDIWVLKNYADASSWSKIISLDAQMHPLTISRPFDYYNRKKIPSPKAFRKSGELILETYKKIVSRNLETQEVKELGITGSKFSFVDPYVESLVLLDKPDLTVTY